MGSWDQFDQEQIIKEDKNILLDMFIKIRINWYWFVVGGGIGLLIAVLYLRYSDPIYKVSAKVLVSDEKKGAGLMEGSMLGDLSGMLGAKSTVDNEVEILKTRDLMEQVVKILEANITYFKIGKIRDVELADPPFILEVITAAHRQSAVNYHFTIIDESHFEVSGEGFSGSFLYDESFDMPFVGKVKVVLKSEDLTDQDEYLVKFTSVDNRVGDFMSRLKVEVASKVVSVIDLSFDYPSKEKGETILRTLISSYVEGNIRDKNTIADSTISFIEDRLSLVGNELGNVEGDIQSFKQKSRIADISAQSQLLLENSSHYIKQLADVQTQLSIINSLQDYLSDEENGRLLPSALLPNDMVFNSLVDRYNTLLLERDRKTLSSTRDNPSILNLERQITNLKADIISNIANTKNNLSITKNQIVSKNRQLEGEIRTVPATERAYLDLARQQQIKQELYVFLLQKREETAISKTSNISNSRVIDSPRAGNKPISPKKTFALAIGLLLGLAAPLCVLYISDVFNLRITTKKDITGSTNVPIIGEISHNGFDGEDIIDKSSRTAIAENFRALRTNLSFYLNGHNQKAVLLTSSMSGEGKSFIALNLALVIAFSGKKVVLMEMDLRKPKLSSKLKAENPVGFSNYIITDGLNPKDVIFQSKINENLFLIGSGPIPPNPSELILNERTDQLMSYLKEEFDYIIIDAPPIGLVTDAQLLSKHSDISLYVFRQGYTLKSQIDILNDLSRENKLGKLAALVNDIDKAGAYGNGYSYNYGYGYGYYSESPSKKTFSLGKFLKMKR